MTLRRWVRPGHELPLYFSGLLLTLASQAAFGQANIKEAFFNETMFGGTQPWGEVKQVIIFDGEFGGEYQPMLGTLVQTRFEYGYDIRAGGTITTDLGEGPGTVFNASLRMSPNLANYGGGSLDVFKQWSWDCLPDDVCEPVETPFGGVDGGIGGSGNYFSSDPGATGGSFVMTLTPTLQVLNGSVTGAIWQNFMTFVTEYEYTPYSWQKYALDQLQKHQSPSASTKDVADAGWDEVIGLREFGPQTSANNVNLRDAEYFLRGLAGGTAKANNLPFDTTGLSGPDVWNYYRDELGNRGGSTTLAVYNAWKSFKQFFLNQNISGDDNLPASPPGGEKSNFVGYKLGEQGWNTDQVIDYLQNPENYQEVEVPQTCIFDPILNDCPPMPPDIQIVVKDSGQEINLDIFDVSGAQAGETILLDPVVTGAHSYVVEDNRFLSVILPEEMAALITDTVIHFDGQSQPLVPGVRLTFADFTATEIQAFNLSGQVVDPMSEGQLELAVQLAEGGQGFVASASGQASTFSITSGLNDAWVNAEAANQGMFVTVFPSFELMFAAWFTFDSMDSGGSATLGAPDQRWITALGPYSGTTATLNAELTTGGSFNTSSPTPSQDTNYGTIAMDFANCSQVNVDYDFPGVGENGSMVMTRAVSSNVGLCNDIVAGNVVPTSLSTAEQAQLLSDLIRGSKTESQSAAFTINAGLNDAWANPDANFQGMFLTVFPDLNLMFAAWFTFDSQPSGNDATLGGPDQRWLTALGSYSGTTANLKVENTTGGLFNALDPTPTQDTGYGTLDIDFSDCNNATVTFNLPGAGESGQFSMSRVLNDNVGLCEALSTQ